MKLFRTLIQCTMSLPIIAVCVSSCFGQFNSGIQGTVQDPTGGIVANATVSLLNTETQVGSQAKTDDAGNFRFVSLAPGSYTITVEASGFSKTAINIQLDTGQNLNVPVSVAVSTAREMVVVTAEAPVLNTAESRNQLTLETQALAELPLAGRSMISLVTTAPGAVGRGVTSNGSPGSGIDNFSTETQVDASANGMGAVGNMYVVDGLDISSAIRPGVLNMTPNPDSIQETSIQTNTFSVEYGRASSIQMLMTTKSGAEAFHGNASDYFTDQKLSAGTIFVHDYAPYHSNNVSATIGGPIIPKKQFFFFFSYEPLRSSAATGNGIVTYEDPAFTSWAKQNFPDTLGTKLLTTYAPTAAGTTGVAQTAATLFPGTCGTSATSFLPCATPMVDTGVFNSTSYRNGTQYMGRIDKYFSKDRIYGTIYKTRLDSGGGAVRPAFAATNWFTQYAYQVSETHTFSSTTVNEASFAAMRVEGIQPKTGLFTVPSIGVSSIGVGFGNGFAAGDFIQHNYHWNDVLTHVRGAHTLKFGYQGWFGDDVENFQGPHAQPTFAFNSLLDLVKDAPATESGVAYDPLSGKAVLWDWNAASKTHGLFAQDVWKARERLTLTMGIRWDDFGNPYSRSPLTAFGNFFLGQGSTLASQVTDGVMKVQTPVFNHFQQAWSPRLGFAWSPDKASNWVIRGGVGMFHNWVTPANSQEEFRGNPPGPIYPTFYAGATPAPLFALGTSETPPFGFTYPALAPGTLNAQGGLTGLQFGVGAINPDLKTPVAYNYTINVERKIAKDLVATAGYSGSRATDLLAGGGQQFSVSYGVDINTYAGDLIQHNSTVPTRLNQSFGGIYYTNDDRDSHYNSLIVGVRGIIGSRGFFNAYYTRSASVDNSQVYPTATNVGQYMAPSAWDAPNRLSLTWSYELPGVNHGMGFAGRITGGWSLSGTTILQSGNPYTVTAFNPFIPVKDANGTFIGLAPNSGDYNADGNNLDYPNVVSYATPSSRQAYLNGVFQASNFSVPAMGTEGNEKPFGFRNPGYAETDLNLAKATRITERVSLQLRFEFYNAFNRVNLNGVDSNFNSSTFGRSTGQALPRNIQIGANLKF
jgi:hypothetical protein